MAETAYIVLVRDRDGWRAVPNGPFPAHNDREAIRKAADGYTDDDTNDAMTFVAVPKRSWNPRTMTVTTRRVVNFQPAAGAVAGAEG